jgi:hypothetical protein
MFLASVVLFYWLFSFPPSTRPNGAAVWTGYLVVANDLDSQVDMWGGSGWAEREKGVWTMVV